MRMIDIILKKRHQESLSQAEIQFFIDGYVKGEIPDYQVSALLMAIVLNGMKNDEIAYLTKAMMESGDIIDLGAIQGMKLDKHSTGGVGDKTSLVLGPIVAACGGKVAKMSGRGLGHTGGTLDKLESIPGFRIGLTIDEFIKQVNEIGLAIIGQTADLVPADRKLYALRDVTGTVESIPLVASSIMSKKLATGADAILLDVKYGTGAFFKTYEEASKLADTMVALGKKLNRDTRAVISDMSQPLGNNIGNILEVKEAAETLQGRGPSDLVELCVEAAAMMLMQGKIAKTMDEGTKMALDAIASGAAFNKFKEMVKYQGGDVSYIEDLSKFPVAKYQYDLTAPEDGYVSEINAFTLGNAGMLLGAGRAVKDAPIDYQAGIVLHAKIGNFVHKGDVIATAHTNKEEVEEVLQIIHDAFAYQKTKPSLDLPKAK